MEATKLSRRLPVGAEVLPGGGVHFRVWAPQRKRVEIILEDEGAGAAFALEPEDDGYFSGFVARAGDGSLYRFRLDGDDYLYPDPASRFQPRRAARPLARRRRFKVRLDGQGLARRVAQGTGRLRAARRRVHARGHARGRRRAVERAGRSGCDVRRADAGGGVSRALRLGLRRRLPLRADAALRRARRPAPLRQRSTRARRRRHPRRRLQPPRPRRQLPRPVLATLLHRPHTRPSGARRSTSTASIPGPVREFFLSNARYWIEEFHFDGLRLDATQSIFDASQEHFLAALTRDGARRRRVARDDHRRENEPQDTRLVRPPERGGHGLDGLWNDDFHHSATVALTGRSEAYYTDYRGTPQEFVSAAKYGFLYQGQRYKWQRQRRGTPTFGLAPKRSSTSYRTTTRSPTPRAACALHRLTSPGRLRAMTALALLAARHADALSWVRSSPRPRRSTTSPTTRPSLAEKVRRRPRRVPRAVPQHRHARDAHSACPTPPPPRPSSAASSTSPNANRTRRSTSCTATCSDLRREDAVFSAQEPRGLDGAVLAPTRSSSASSGRESDDRLLVVNLGPDLNLNPAPEPLLAPPPGKVWQTVWSSEDYRYGGTGTPRLETKNNWCSSARRRSRSRPLRRERGERPRRRRRRPERRGQRCAERVCASGRKRGSFDLKFQI